MTEGVTRLLTGVVRKRDLGEVLGRADAEDDVGAQAEQERTGASADVAQLEIRRVDQQRQHHHHGRHDEQRLAPHLSLSLSCLAAKNLTLLLLLFRLLLLLRRRERKPKV